ncbi:MAG TPA: hypothetical protein VJ233_09350 [Hyphomicrobiaceae bacterium]|nr:hypothetical protein [Hyphomicrobiaceae bacterium]
MLKHGIALGLFSLLAVFATPSVAEQAKSQTFSADSCGYVCIFADSGR